MTMFLYFIKRKIYNGDYLCDSNINKTDGSGITSCKGTQFQ